MTICEQPGYPSARIATNLSSRTALARIVADIKAVK